MSHRISLRCPKCNVKLKAAFQLVGSTCRCPRCSHQVVVRLPIPSDADIVLAADNELRARSSGLPFYATLGR